MKAVARGGAPACLGHAYTGHADAVTASDPVGSRDG